MCLFVSFPQRVKLYKYKVCTALWIIRWSRTTLYNCMFTYKSNVFLVYRARFCCLRKAIPHRGKVLTYLTLQILLMINQWASLNLVSDTWEVTPDFLMCFPVPSSVIVTQRSAGTSQYPSPFVEISFLWCDLENRCCWKYYIIRM